MKALAYATVYASKANTAILARVGSLITLSESGFATIEQVAEFYQVSIKTIQTIVARHRDELEQDGYRVLTRKQFEELTGRKPHSQSRYIAIFPRRAILRVGMLLVESEVAKQVRHYLLAAESHSLGVPDRQSLMEMAEQLQTQAVKIAENARRSSENAEQLKEQAAKNAVIARRSSENAQQLISQANIVKAMVQEMYRDREEVRKVRERVDKLELRFTMVDDSPRLQQDQEEYITDRQIEILREKVKQMPGKAVSIWKKFNKRFGITRYKFLPAVHFNEALAWLNQYGESYGN